MPTIRYFKGWPGRAAFAAASGYTNNSDYSDMMLLLLQLSIVLGVASVIFIGSLPYLMIAYHAGAVVVLSAAYVAVSIYEFAIWSLITTAKVIRWILNRR